MTFASLNSEKNWASSNHQAARGAGYHFRLLLLSTPQEKLPLGTLECRQAGAKAFDLLPQGYLHVPNVKKFGTLARAEMLFCKYVPLLLSHLGKAGGLRGQRFPPFVIKASCAVGSCALNVKVDLLC
mmetsp:Transcript_25618/g.60071  ORF Transcript_25618/g.60071 Transcript_25618/m.60071 type:complete len:127 (+) Transcript_25618:213-593(+)